MYAFVAENKAQAKALEKYGAFWASSMGVWVARDLSSWKLWRLKRKGLVPKAAGFPMATTKPSLKWPRWIMILTLAPPVALATLCIWLAQNTADFPVFKNILFVCGVSAFWFVFVYGLSKIAYAFYRRLRGDRSYWENLDIKSAPLFEQSYNEKLIMDPTFCGVLGNIFHNREYNRHY